MKQEGVLRERKKEDNKFRKEKVWLKDKNYL